ncbi:MAG TPA: hypothetical protein VHX88_09970 [Solirubrobacteraceae bacterium]|jgi:hypothetical protein|nr:hypothetical protein [Solirubrobacteraceae bacterium]
MPAAGVVLLIAVVAVVGALVWFLVNTILALKTITDGLDEAIAGVGEIVAKTEPVNGVVTTINQHLDAGVSALEGLLVKKAGLTDAMGLIDGLYPGAAAQGLREVPDSTGVRVPRIGAVYTRGTLTLARLGREAPIAAASPNGPAVRNPLYATSSASALYPDARQGRPAAMPRSPVIGTDAPVQYQPTDEPGVRRHLPGRTAVLEPPGSTGESGAPPPAPEQREERSSRWPPLIPRWKRF